MLINGIIRSFNPIGQGSFVTEHFYKNGTEHTNVIFDAGFLKSATKGGETKAKRLIQGTLAKDTPISAIFISHLDEDHVGLVPYILHEYHGQVKNIILPRFSQETVFAYLFWYSAQSMAPATGKKRWSRNLAQLVTEVARKLGYVSSDEENRLLDQSGPNWHFILPYEGERHPPFWEDNNNIEAVDLEQDGFGQTKERSSGSAFRLVEQSCRWFFVPYHREVLDGKYKAQIFWKQLIKSFSQCFQYGSYHLSRPFFSGDPNALTKLRKLSECVLSQKSNYSRLKGIYEKTWGDRNRDSMVVASFTSSDCDIQPYYDIPIIPRRFWFDACLYECDFFHLLPAAEPGALYTGDSNAAELPLEILKRNLSVSQNIGSIQVPHHGSARSWDSRLALASATLYFASYGSSNIYGHPAPKVARDLVSNFKVPLFYNEHSPPYIQVYRFI